MIARPSKERTGKLKEFDANLHVAQNSSTLMTPPQSTIAQLKLTDIT